MSLKMDENKSHLTLPYYDHGNHHRAWDEFHWMPMLRLQDTDTSNTMHQLVSKSLAPKMDENKSLIKELQVYVVFLSILFVYPYMSMINITCSGEERWHAVVLTLISSTLSMQISCVATGGAQVAECHPWQRKICQKSGKKREKSGKIKKKEEKSGRKGKNWEGSFTLPLLTDRAGYATDANLSFISKIHIDRSV